MPGIKINKVAAAWLLIVLVVGFSQDPKTDKSNDFSTKQNEPIMVDGYGCNYRMQMIPPKPNLGDIVRITFYIESPYRNVPEFRVRFKLLRGAELVRGKTVQLHPSLKKGKSANFFITVKINARIFQISAAAHAHIPGKYNRDEWGHCLGAADIDMVVLAKNDTISYEKFGNDTELWPRIGPEYQYDIVEGVRIPPVGPTFSKEAQKIREEIEGLKKLDPTISDWDALELLHDAIYEMIVRYGIHKKEESVSILLEARKLMREKGLSKWEAVDKVVDEMKKGKGRIDFFRPDGSGNINYSADSTPKQRVDITISGTIKYKKHLANKDTGLDTATVDKPLKHAKIYIRGYWLGQGAQFFGPTSTDDNGYFSYTIGGVTAPGYFMPLAFLRRPGAGITFDRVKVISDTIKFTLVPSPEDSNIWRYRWKVDTLYSSTNIGTRYCAEHFLDGGLWPDNHQPGSGAANIFDNMIKGYEYCVENGYTGVDTIYKAVARWQPGYKHGTKAKLFAGASTDTIWICGDTTGEYDEWTDEMG